MNLKTVAGYFGGDDFVVIMPNERPLIINY